MNADYVKRKAPAHPSLSLRKLKRAGRLRAVDIESPSPSSLAPQLGAPCQTFPQPAPPERQPLVSSKLASGVRRIASGRFHAKPDRPPLSGCRAAILIASGFEQREMQLPREALIQAGGRVCLVSTESGAVSSWNQTARGEQSQIDAVLPEVRADQFDALLLPGGVTHVEKLRRSSAAIDFIRHFLDHNKPVAAISHGPILLVHAGLAKGKRVTSCDGWRNELRAAGADWLPQAVVVDQNLITARKSSDLPQFIARMLRLFADRIRTAAPRES